MSKLKNLLLSGLVLISFTTAVPAWAAEEQSSVIRVTGYAEKELTPDTAFVTMSTETLAVDADTARVNNIKVMNKLSEGLKALGIEANDMKTLNYSLRPMYDQASKKITRYKVNNSLRVKVTDLKLLGKVLSKGAEAGVNRVSGVEFTCSDAAEVKADLISAAVANGKLVAKSAVMAAGGELGKVKEINVSGHFPVFQARNTDGMVMLKSVNADMAEETPNLEVGTQKVSESVDMVFYIE